MGRRLANLAAILPWPALKSKRSFQTGRQSEPTGFKRLTCCYQDYDTQRSDAVANRCLHGLTLTCQTCLRVTDKRPVGVLRPRNPTSALNAKDHS